MDNGGHHIDNKKRKINGQDLDFVKEVTNDTLNLSLSLKPFLPMPDPPPTPVPVNGNFSRISPDRPPRSSPSIPVYLNFFPNISSPIYSPHAAASVSIVTSLSRILPHRRNPQLSNSTLSTTIFICASATTVTLSRTFWKRRWPPTAATLSAEPFPTPPRRKEPRDRAAVPLGNEPPCHGAQPPAPTLHPDPHHNRRSPMQEMRAKLRREMGFDLRQKLFEIFRFIIENKSQMYDRAPTAWMNPALPPCRFCGEENCVKPIVSDKKKTVNWLFLLLGQMLGFCTLGQLKYFCKHTKNHRTGAKDRVLYLTYLGLCKQLDPNGPFDR